MEKKEIERDLLFALEFATAAISLYIAWQILARDVAFRELRMRYFRGVSRTATKVADRASIMALNANTAYWQTAQR